MVKVWGIDLPVLLTISYLLVAVLAVTIYETARALFLRWLQRRVERRVRAFAAEQGVAREPFKFAHKMVVKELLLSDRIVNEQILEHAKTTGTPVAEVRRRVEEYADEIIPAFNLLTYYEVGFRLAKFFVNLVYEPSVDKQALERTTRIPGDAVVVYIMNHRSNMDYVLVAYVLAGRVALSYAVGEWARVWPLEYLFKSFGSYFVRRGYREDLYHRVLERYVNLIAKQGVTQGIFPEGKLSRDGTLLPPKVGLLQYIAGAEADPEFTRRLVFVPVGINYDWVLEDKALLDEARGIVREKRWTQKARVLVTGPAKFARIVGTNMVRRLTRRVKHHGSAAVSFGKPVDFRAWLDERGVTFRELDREERKPVVADFARDLMAEVGKAVPVTHLAVVSHALLALGKSEVTLEELVRETAKFHRRFLDAGAPSGYAQEFQKLKVARSDLEEAASQREGGPEVLDMERELLDQQEAEFVVRRAVDVLRRRKLAKRSKGAVRVSDRARPHLRYYANSVGHHIGVVYPFETGTLPTEEQAVEAPVPTV